MVSLLWLSLSEGDSSDKGLDFMFNPGGGGGWACGDILDS